MLPAAVPESATPNGRSDADRAAALTKLKAQIELSGELLPSQGPITAFVFLNTLQALEHLPFEEGLKRGAYLFGCQPYLSEERYRQKMTRGRILTEDLEAVLRYLMGSRADERLIGTSTRLQLQMAMVEHPLRTGPSAELRWIVATTDALTKIREEAPDAARQRIIDETRHWVMRDLRSGGAAGDVPLRSGDPRVSAVLNGLLKQFGETSIESWTPATWTAFSLHALWHACRDGVQRSETPTPNDPLPLRHRDLLLALTGEDSDTLVHEVLIRFCAAFLDQGFAPWPLPIRKLGLFKGFCTLYQQSGGPPDRWLRGLDRELARIEQSGMSALESVQESLELLGVSEHEWDDFIPLSLLALRGWAGMIWQADVRSDRVPFPVPPGSLTEFLAVRLILERWALGYLARRIYKDNGSLSGLRDRMRSAIPSRASVSEEQRSFLVFQVAQILGWSAHELFETSKADWRKLVSEMEAFPQWERRRVLHLAYERRFRRKALDAIAVHSSRPALRVHKPRFQAAFCIDAREESFRRHLEELSPDVETFGVAGFYCVAMYYRGVADAHYQTLCPIVVRPKHWVIEEVVYSLGDQHRRRGRMRSALGSASHQVHVGSRSMALGAFLTAVFGVLASIPLVARVLFPRFTARIRRTAGKFVEPPPVTRLLLERTAADPGPDGDHIGFTMEEMADICERTLRDMGLTSSFARLVILLGHGSFCLNNPHKSAYDCGACSGSAGGPNARALAAMVNSPKIREILARRNLHIPADTVFVGGLHNTCEDSLTFFDLDLLPRSHHHDFEAAKETLERTCERNAHERCRRFMSAPLNLSYEAARIHVEGRSEDLAQTRPEYGNASNAMCVVGRRARTRGLYLDRRSFLVSYDPEGDDAEYTILGRVLGAVVPVCEGINLQYFFSYIDSSGMGAGTKLPHNITSLLGVMDGAASDLRSGLPWQGVEIHEPVRCLFVIETVPEAIFKIMARNENVSKILRNGWVQLALLDPHSSTIRLFRDGEFKPYTPLTHELPHAATSIDWYRGWREHLDFAVIDGPRSEVRQ